MSSIEVKEIGSIGDLESFREPWTSLQAESHQATVFGTWEWQFAAAKHLAGDGTLRVFIVFVDDEPAGILPMLQRRIKVGGIILFARNLQSPDQIRALCRSVQAHARACGQPPLFIAIDQEGGTVARLKPPFTQFPGNPSMKAVEDAIHFARTTASELSTSGINMNMAPVLDFIPPGLESVMAERAFSGDPERVSVLGTAIITHLQRNRIMAVGKHFPGIGRTTLDSHVERPVLDADSRTLADDLIPFKAAIKAGVAGIMLAHILYSRLDAGWPASLSVRIASDLLRKKLGFMGVVITDDLDMGAIVKHYEIEQVIARVLLADIDIALICHPGPTIERTYEVIVKTMTDDRRERAKGIESAGRIMRLKQRFLAV